MEFLRISLFILSITCCYIGVGNGQSIIDIREFGAKGDGYTDDTQAFLNAWNNMCGSSNGSNTLVVPAGYSFLVGQIRFKGPCQSEKVHIQVLGNITAPTKSEWRGACSNRWLSFLEVNDMTLDGSGTINGQGQSWWANNGTGGCPALPTAFVFEKCNGLQIQGLSFINSPKFHVHVVHSENVTISQVSIHSPEESHNTDGIDITNSIRVNIHDSIIGTGDDCIAIKGGSQFINISKVTCGPGHGISVGSIGSGGQEEFVENVHVWNCTFNDAIWAARIKTCPGGKGYVKDITYEKIKVNQINFPILIDQHYMNTPEQPQAVKVSNVRFSDIVGTCSSEKAIVLDCANITCSNLILEQINIVSINSNTSVSATCNNAQGSAMNITSPLIPCLH